MPIERLIANGMSYADAIALHADTEVSGDWTSSAQRLASRNLERADLALGRGHAKTARSWLLHAAACLRFGQGPLPDADPRKRDVYAEMLDAFGRAGVVHQPTHRHVSIPWQGGHLSGWLIEPETPRPTPTVIVLGGIDAWREEFEVGASYLTERGLTAFLVDAPGQGETRLFGGLHFDAHAVPAIGAFIDVALARPRSSGTVGLWGNSAGGWLATHVAARDRRVRACCVNGGTDRPTEILDRYPRYIDRLQQFTGRTEPEEARAVIDDLQLSPGILAQLTCPFHVVHGTPDRVFMIDGARRLYQWAASEQKTFTEFADGDHCISNRAHEKDALIADWFVDHLG